MRRFSVFLREEPGDGWSETGRGAIRGILKSLFTEEKATEGDGTGTTQDADPDDIFELERASAYGPSRNRDLAHPQFIDRETEDDGEQAAAEAARNDADRRAYEEMMLSPRESMTRAIARPRPRKLWRW